MRILITGAGGRLGKVLTRELGGRHDLRLGDLRPIDDPRYVPLDICDVAQLRAAMDGCDAVVSLAIADEPSLRGANGQDYFDAAFAVHVKGTYNVVRTAADLGARRVIYTSSVSAVAGYPDEVTIGSDDPPLGGGLYGITKGLGETICHEFHVSRGLPVAILRLGNVWFEGLNWVCNRHPHPSRVDSVDVARAIGQVLETPQPPFALVHIVGDNPGRCWDLEAARTLYGWQPRRRFGEDGQPTDAALSARDR